MKRSILFLSLFMIGSAWSAQETFTIDPDHSQVGFKVRHLLSKLPGRFTKFEGSIAIDPKKLPMHTFADDAQQTP